MKNRKKLSEFAGLEIDLPNFDLPTPGIELDAHHEEPEHDLDKDNEGAMVKADLFKLARYSVRLFKKIENEDQFESWVQAKITKAADYISSVYHYLEYEMKFSEYGEKIENSDMYSESQKRQLKQMISEGRKQLAYIKIKQAERLSESKVVAEGISKVCGECGGTGVVEKELPEATKQKIKRYNRLTKAMTAAVDRNHNGIDDRLENDQEVFDDGAPDSPIPPKNKAKPPVGTDKPKKTSAPKKDSSDSESSSDKPKKSAPKKDSGDSESSSDKPKKSAPKKDSESSSDKTKKEKSSEKSDSKTESIYGGSVYGESAKKKAVAMWNNVKETAAYIAEKEDAEKDWDKDGKKETKEKEYLGVKNNAIKAAEKEKETIKESVELQRLREITSRVIL